MATRLLPLATLLLTAGIATSGCGQGAGDAAVRDTASRFLQAVASGDGEAACEQLSSQTRSQLEQSEGRECRVAVTDLRVGHGGVASVQVFVQNAMVELADGEAEFLEQGSQGWRLSAVGCHPHGDQPHNHPYDCELAD